MTPAALLALCVASILWDVVLVARSAWREVDGILRLYD